MVPTIDYIESTSSGSFVSLETSSVVGALFEGYLEFPYSSNKLSRIYDLCLVDEYSAGYQDQSNLYIDDSKIIDKGQRCAQVSLEGVKKMSIETMGKVRLYWRKSSSLVHLPSSEWLKVS